METIFRCGLVSKVVWVHASTRVAWCDRSTATDPEENMKETK